MSARKTDATIPFCCPCCGEVVRAELLTEAVVADPDVPCLRCRECKAAWCVALTEARPGEEAPW